MPNLVLFNKPFRVLSQFTDQYDRKSVPDSWMEVVICEGRNRQIRRMTASVGLPTLRLIRVAIGNWRIDNLLPGQSRTEQVPLPLVY